MTIPYEEQKRLEEAIRDAHRLAAAGQVPGGYELLDLMLAWAENPAYELETGKVAPPEPWAEALCDGYRAALVAYAAEQGVRFPLPSVEPLTPREKAEALHERSQRLRERSRVLLVRSRELRRPDCRHTAHGRETGSGATCVSVWVTARVESLG